MKEIILYVRKDIKAGKHVCEMGSNVENCQIRNKVLRDSFLLGLVILACSSPGSSKGGVLVSITSVLPCWRK